DGKSQHDQRMVSTAHVANSLGERVRPTTGMVAAPTRNNRFRFAPAEATSLARALLCPSCPAACIAKDSFGRKVRATLPDSPERMQSPESAGSGQLDQ